MGSQSALPVLVIGLGCFALTAAETNLAPQTAPCPPGKTFRSIEWHWDTYQTAAPGSDLWPVTWGPDDQLYTAWGDGGGFGGSDSDGRVSLGFAKIEGDPQHFQ